MHKQLKPPMNSQEENLSREILQKINKVPECVKNGGVYMARDWKEKAFKAMKAAQRSPKKLNELQDALNSLKRFD